MLLKNMLIITGYLFNCYEKFRKTFLIIDFFFYGFDYFRKISVSFHFIFYFFAGIQNSGIMFSSKKLTYLRKRIICHLSYEIHCYLPWISYKSCRFTATGWRNLPCRRIIPYCAP